MIQGTYSGDGDGGMLDCKCKKTHISLQSITEASLPEMQRKYFQEGSNILYGAGFTGQRFLVMLTNLGVRIDYFVDDSPVKVDTEIGGCRVLSFADMEERAERHRMNVIIATIYGNTVLCKLQSLPVKIFEAFELYQQNYGESLAQNLTLAMPKKEWFSKLQAVKALCDDQESQKVLDTYQEAVRKDVFEFAKISAVASQEDHYFVSEIRKTLLGIQKPLRIVDCGAYVGDIFWQLERWKIPIERLYAYEASEDIFKKLEENVQKQGMSDKTVLFPFACWNEETDLYFDSSPGEDTAGTIVCRGGKKVRAKRIDDTVMEPIDFLKTDIEGAERAALRGAVRTLLESRPCLAISIYHSLDDVVDLPLYLAGLLDGYHWFIRHHSLIWCETVLYGIPKLRKENT